MLVKESEGLKERSLSKPPAFSWAVPKELGLPEDTLRLRLDFYHQSTVMTLFEGDVSSTKLVSAMDVAHALANELNFCTGLLPENTLWWKNTRSGPQFAFWVEPQVHKLALQIDPEKPARRFNIPLPGLIFVCSPCRPPWIFASKSKPTKETDMLYKAPLLNVFDNGRSCPGSNKYPERVQDIVQGFFLSFFSNTADLGNRSKKYPKSILDMWESLEKNKASKYPLEDLVEHCTVKDAMAMEER